MIAALIVYSPRLRNAPGGQGLAGWQDGRASADRLKKGLPPETYEKVLELMAADDPLVPETSDGEEPFNP